MYCILWPGVFVAAYIFKHFSERVTYAKVPVVSARGRRDKYCF